jgi:hypothetical protein
LAHFLRAAQRGARFAEPGQLHLQVAHLAGRFGEGAELAPRFSRYRQHDPVGPQQASEPAHCHSNIMQCFGVAPRSQSVARGGGAVEQAEGIAGQRRAGGGIERGRRRAGGGFRFCRRHVQ